MSSSLPEIRVIEVPGVPDDEIWIVSRRLSGPPSGVKIKNVGIPTPEPPKPAPSLPQGHTSDKENV